MALHDLGLGGNGRQPSAKPTTAASSRIGTEMAPKRSGESMLVRSGRACAVFHLTLPSRASGIATPGHSDHDLHAVV
jgi:hypothetical protein